MKAQGSIEIVATPDRVWRFMVDPEKIKQWWIGLEEFEFENERGGGPGERFFCEERAGGRLMRLYFVYTEWVPARRLAFSMTLGDVLKGREQVWSVTPIDTGCRFTLEEEITLPFGVVGRVLETFIAGQLEARVGKMLAILKGLAELDEGAGPSRADPP